MNPLAQEVLKSCVQNLEELVAPDLSDPHAKSALMCVRMLINHVVLRLDLEGDALVEDCRDKRALYSGLADADSFDPSLVFDIRGLLKIEEPVHTPIALITARNEAWKRIAERILASQIDEQTRHSVRAQLQRQIGRENAYCAPAMDRPMF